MDRIEKIIKSRSFLPKISGTSSKGADEGGCGVIGFAATEKIAGKHLLKALDQMKNRGNGKGGGVAILGLDPDQLGVSQQVLKTHYILQIAYLDTSIRKEVEENYIFNNFDVVRHYRVESLNDYTAIGLEVKPPVVHRYFCKVKHEVLNTFVEEHDLEVSDRKSEDEFVYQNSYHINTTYYASLGDKKAFVLSHSKNLLVFKLVGYANHVILYYQLDKLQANIWIGHHRYPTKGTVWHPGGAHPFIGLNEALVHNGDFSNYHAVSQYLAQRNIFPQFLTDTEVAALQFDLYSRIYEYPIEYLIEALAPTTERDFYMLPKDKQYIYREIQHTHLHGSPDGPWFFIIGRSLLEGEKIQLLGITDTSMLRPQVFAMYEKEGVSIGLIGSEKQAIDATLQSLASEDSRFSRRADIYWNARGGSYTDGGAFILNFNLDTGELSCTDKFGNFIETPTHNSTISYTNIFEQTGIEIPEGLEIGKEQDLRSICVSVKKQANNSDNLEEIILFLTKTLDHWHLFPDSLNGMKKSMIEDTLDDVFRMFPSIESKNNKTAVLLDWSTRNKLRAPSSNEQFLVIDISDFDMEGKESAASYIIKSYQLGWKHLYTFDWRGQRFCGSGLGPNSSGFRIEVYGNPGDYLASGLDGAEIYVHTSVQDQVAQMMKSGKLVIYGDVGQTFMYGAKGGEVYVLGNAAGRPLINAVGKPRVVINGPCLDYLAESFMAGNPLNGGGFVILNGLKFTNEGKSEELDTPYAGGNLFSLASGGAIYIYDPTSQVTPNQLNGGQISNLTKLDLEVIKPYLFKNIELFNLNYFDNSLSDNGKYYLDKYRSIKPVKLKELSSH